VRRGRSFRVPVWSGRVSSGRVSSVACPPATHVGLCGCCLLPCRHVCSGSRSVGSCAWTLRLGSCARTLVCSRAHARVLESGARTLVDLCFCSKMLSSDLCRVESNTQNFLRAGRALRFVAKSLTNSLIYSNMLQGDSLVTRLVTLRCRVRNS